ncbi:hypothetical protein GPECTOR_7g1140 [Gonium pectorale]|uniref:Uncharacterized protein n=1 Tax=Gonium pectorale TaxID=33097 RepID=A0A150GTP3_GONPE|nr:hypothetical protein GPECTOR_7g1140 [Gonium pectorale]|eukprot:KXZ53246.1 hypothetical protein GPECTOR_7g1140 [Gonium pectorale]
MHRVPYSATNFWTYEATKKALQGRLGNDVARAWAAGATSGLVACTAAYPLDLLRTRVAAETQCGAAQQYRRLPAALRRIVAEQGVLGLYKGLGATLAQVVPGLAFNFCFYDSFKRLALTQQQRYQDFLERGHREQQQQLGEREPAGALERSGVCRPHAHECQGRHLAAAQQERSAGDAYASCYQAQAAHARTMRAEAGAPPSPSPLTSAFCACASGFCTSTLTFPLDVVRRRLQVYERGPLARLRYGDVVRAVYSEGGFKAFYRGIGPEYAKVLPGMAIAFTTYEALKRLTGAAP